MSGGDPGAYIPPLSLWQLVEQNVSPSEQNEIKNMLGESLIDTTLELHQEVNMLMEIWRDYNDETEIENKHKLAEPPHMRDRLIQEISFLAENIREKSLRKGMNPTAVLSKHKAEVLEYAQESRRCGTAVSCPQSARSADGRQTPLSPTDQATNRAALSSTITAEVTSSSARCNYMQFDQVCNRLRDTLTKEMEQLKSDVNFLQGCLDNAAECRSRGSSPALSRQPTITELREERSLLEKDLLSTECILTTPPVRKHAFQPTSAPNSIKILGTLSNKLRPVHAGPVIASEPAKAKPLKASHHITQNKGPASSSDGSITSRSSTPDSLTSKETVPNAEDGDTSFSGGGDMAPAEGGMLQGNQFANRAVIMKTYDFGLPAVPAIRSPRSLAPPATRSPQDRHRTAADEGIKRRDGPGTQRHRTISPARVKVVPVSSILEPQGESATGRPFLPTPPPSEKPQLTRPSSADRFRKIVLQYRETS